MRTVAGQHEPRPRRSGLDVLPDEGGFALLTVIGAMFVLSIFAMGSLSLALQGLPQSRKAQDSTAAVAAAQAGVDDLVTRLNACDAYWTAADPRTVCPAATEDLALNGHVAGTWAEIEGTSPVQPARYRYRFLSTPETTPGLLRIEATGQVNGVSRAMTADLRRPSFLNYVYYTDYETSDPLTLKQNFPPRRFDSYRFSATGFRYRDVRFLGLTDGQVAACARYHYGPDGARPASQPESYTYSGSPTPAPTRARTCDIAFQGSGATPDVIRGPLHTNDAILISGGPVSFLDTVHTAWPADATPAPGASWFRSVSGGSAAGNAPGYAPPVNMPESAPQETIAAARNNGCLFTGPTRIEYLATGQMTVQSPFSTGLPPNGSCGPNGNGTVQPPVTVPGPANGVIHVQPRTSGTCTGAPLEILGRYPVADDITRYDCRAGDAFVSGVVQRPSNVYAAGDVVITGNLTYNSSGSVLGLMADNRVLIYHPVRCKAAPLDPIPAGQGFACPEYDLENIPGTALTNLVVHAAILSREHSFTVQNYDKGASMGTLTVVGGIYQRYRGIVLTNNWYGQTGYIKDYQYDPRLRSLPPPAFMPPKDSAWQVSNVSEQVAS